MTDSLQIKFSLDVKEHEINVERDDIKRLETNYEQGQIEIHLNPQAIVKIHNYLRAIGKKQQKSLTGSFLKCKKSLLEHSIEIDDPSKHFIEINFNTSPAHHVNNLKNFFT